MFSNIKSFTNIKDSQDLGQKLFFLGLFFLPSALVITGIFFIASLFISFRLNKINFFETKWDSMFSISLILIILSSIYNTFVNIPVELISLSKFYTWISLFNWVPFYFFFWGFKSFLKTEKQREISFKFLISGSIPVLVSCILQQFFGFYGPYKTFYDLIVWFNKPINEIGGVSGLFSNPNYTGIFLALILPFLFFFVKSEENKNLLKKSLLYLFIILTLYFSISTNSRNALIGVLISFCSIIKFNKFKLIILTSLSGAFIFLNYLSNILKLIFKKSILEIQSICFQNDLNLLFCKILILQQGLSTPRMRIWLTALTTIQERPLMGWGSSTFSYLYPIKESIVIPYRNLEINHSHNIILEIAHSFGIPCALILTFTVLSILLSALKLVIKKNDLHSINQSWIFSLGILLILHLSDITYYDGRISLIFVILLTGSKCIIQGFKKYKYVKN